MSHRTNTDDDWELMSPVEAPTSNVRPKNDNPYLDFQLSTWFGHFSFVVTPIPRPAVLRVEDVAEKPFHQQDQSHLFKLPVEIRLYIYELLLSPSSHPHGLQIGRLPHDYPVPSVLTILLSCRRALFEAETIFYSINRISVKSPQFWTAVGTRRRNAITKFALPARSGASTVTGLQQLVQFAPQLKSLHIVRETSIRFIDPRPWAVMMPNLAAEIAKMQALEEIKVLTPEAPNMTEQERARKQRLDELDSKLCALTRDKNAVR